MKSSKLTGWNCAQIGAREHYAVPRALHRSGQLSLLCTDFWAGAALRRGAKLAPLRKLRALASRFHPELEENPKARVTSWNFRALSWDERLRRCSQHRDTSDAFLGFTEIGCEFATAVRQELKRRRDWSPESIFFAYDTGALETLEWLREQGARSIVSQIDPSRWEVEMVREEEQRWPGWTKCTTNVPEAYFRRREKEWALADRIVVNSEFCREALVKQGVPDSKLSVIPLSYEVAYPQPKNHGSAHDDGPLTPGSRPFRVLWLGQVILRKGIQYLLEAARLLVNENIEFDVVGPIGISDAAIKSAPPNVKFHGAVARDQISRWYEQADLFALPTLSDGFGLTQVEAMSHGLPVVVTANCGKVVTDGLDGFIVPLRDSEALARAIHSYRVEPNLWRDHRAAAFKKSGEFTIDQLVGKLSLLETELRK